MSTKLRKRRKIGFAAMSKQKRTAVASKGGRASAKAKRRSRSRR